VDLWLFIMYRTSSDGGTNWAMAQRLTWNSGESWSPNIAMFGSDNIHVVWYDTTPGNYEVYYKRQKQGIRGRSLSLLTSTWENE